MWSQFGHSPQEGAVVTSRILPGLILRLRALFPARLALHAPRARNSPRPLRDRRSPGRRWDGRGAHGDYFAIAIRPLITLPADSIRKK
jgi:hypothetical protein